MVNVRIRGKWTMFDLISKIRILEERNSNLGRAVFGFGFVECDRWFENSSRIHTREFIRGSILIR